MANDGILIGRYYPPECMVAGKPFSYSTTGSPVRIKGILIEDKPTRLQSLALCPTGMRYVCLVLENGRKIILSRFAYDLDDSMDSSPYSDLR